MKPKWSEEHCIRHQDVVNNLINYCLSSYEASIYRQVKDKNGTSGNQIMFWKTDGVTL